ncbi:hypothetical protein A1O1_08717 [Capronia coronata CBS 617.96]|uniref:Uncharacterized protein n=1 Tax=Capronia coronata CBS 617.96 TaxID=1182541 RepID=W9XU92_9EURO|nr:uncharacterized protein A1O1_08717 [Capronia coronata CBS 617.96]EXJ80571.1 hypothetical protein A1O1_08717 [Capronia coronata CBS 617.96]
MAEGFNGMAMDQPAGASKTNPHAAEAWLEPWLIKHSEFYRKHLARGRSESKATRRHSEVSEALESRNNSVTAPESEHTVEAGAGAGAGVEATSSMPVPVEQPRHGDEVDTPPHEAEAENRTDDKGLHGWRKHLSWFPHP